MEINDRRGKVLCEVPGDTLRGADLPHAYLYGADLRGSDLRDSDLRGATLRGADLRFANLYGADLRGAYLRRADLRGADLRCADLTSADLTCAELTGADLTGAKLPDISLPQGDLIGYKKLRAGQVITLRIPAAARRTRSYTSNKCRAEYAEVISDEPEGTILGYAIHCMGFAYIVGQRIVPDSYDDDVRQECTHGVHFFLTCDEAEAY
jgi:hypothetical protein